MKNVYRILYIDDCGNKWVVKANSYDYIKELEARFYQILEIICY